MLCYLLRGLLMGEKISQMDPLTSVTPGDIVPVVRPGIDNNYSYDLGTAQQGVTDSITALTFGTRAASAGTVVPSTTQMVVTTGGTASGDGGRASYSVSGVEPSHAGKIALGGGKWAELADAPNPLNTGYSDLATLRAIERATGKVAYTRRFTDFFTKAQVIAMLTDVWTGIDMSDFRTRVQKAFDASDANHLVLPPYAFIKLNGPVMFDNGQTIAAPACGGEYTRGLTFYADLSVDWRATWPRRGILESRNFSFPSSFPPAWDIPNFCGNVLLQNFAVHAFRDFATNGVGSLARQPDYCVAWWSPNEESTARRVRCIGGRRSAWLIGGYMSVMQIEDCGGWQSGVSVDTDFGNAVTRTTGGAFSGTVTVLSSGSTGETQNVITLEAASATDLDTIISGNVLSVDPGFGITPYSVTVSGAPAATESITLRTRIAGALTTTRYMRQIPIATANYRDLRGRVFPAGLAMTDHPDPNFADAYGSGSPAGPVSASLGGRANGGSIRIYGFSGDANEQSLIFADGSQIMDLRGLKAEANPSTIHISGVCTGGAAPAIALGGHRGELRGATDQGFIRMTGMVRPTFTLAAGRATNYANYIEDRTPFGGTIANSASGAFGGFYSTDGNSSFRAPTILTESMTVSSNNAQLTLSIKGQASYTSNLRTDFANSNTYRFRIGSANHVLWGADGSVGNGTNGFFLTAWDSGSSTRKNAITLTDNSVNIVPTGGQKVGFFGATAVVRPTVSAAATDPATTQTLVNDLRTALIALGLVA